MAMDEAAIVASKMPSGVIESPVGDNAKDNAPVDGETPDNNFKTLYKHFGIEEESERHDKALSLIYDYAKKEAGSTDRDEIIWQIIKLNNRLGSSALDEKPYLKMENYLIAWQRQREAERVVRELENGQ